jgi:hypothetical protein
MKERRGSGDKAPRSLNIGTEWKEIVAFKLWPLQPWTLRDLDAMAKKKISDCAKNRTPNLSALHWLHSHVDL